MDVQVPYGEKDGRSFHVDEVENGIKCGCVCPGCGKKLIAVNREGIKTAHHFRHENRGGYKTCLESSLHLAAKDILLETKQVTLPAVEYEFPGNQPSFTLASKRTIHLDEVILEKREGNITPDVIAVANGKRLFIEIHVTNPVNEEKLQKIIEMGAAAIEVNLSEYDREFDRKTLRASLCKSDKDKSWLHNPRKIEFQAKVLLLCDIRRYRTASYSGHEVPECPIHESEEFSPRDKPLEECKECQYCITTCQRNSWGDWGEVMCAHKAGGDFLQEYMGWVKEKLFGNKGVQ